MAGDVVTSRFPKAATGIMAEMNYAHFFELCRENGSEIELSQLCMGMAAGELAIAITPPASDVDLASSLHSRLPHGKDAEMNPEKIFDFLTDEEKKYLPRATAIIDLIRGSFAIELNALRREI